MVGHVKKSTGVSNLLDSDVSPGEDVSNSDQSSMNQLCEFSIPTIRREFSGALPRRRNPNCLTTDSAPFTKTCLKNESQQAETVFLMANI